MRVSGEEMAKLHANEHDFSEGVQVGVKYDALASDFDQGSSPSGNMKLTKVILTYEFMPYAFGSDLIETVSKLKKN